MEAIAEPLPESPVAAQAALRPTERQLATRITSSNARERIKIRWDRYRAAKALQSTDKPLTLAPEPLRPEWARNLSDEERNTLIRDYRELAALSRARLKTLDDAKDRHQEASTLAKLEACYWRYAGIPGEGTLKPTAPKADKRRSGDVEPT